MIRVGERGTEACAISTCVPHTRRDAFMVLTVADDQSKAWASALCMECKMSFLTLRSSERAALRPNRGTEGTSKIWMWHIGPTGIDLGYVRDRCGTTSERGAVKSSDGIVLRFRAATNQLRTYLQSRSVLCHDDFDPTPNRDRAQCLARTYSRAGRPSGPKVDLQSRTRTQSHVSPRTK